MLWSLMKISPVHKSERIQGGWVEYIMTTRKLREMIDIVVDGNDERLKSTGQRKR